MNWKWTIVFILLAMAYCLGRQHVEEVVKETKTVEYIKGDPYEIEIPGETIVKYLTKEIKVTVPEYIHVPVDTMEIVKDYLLRRGYALDFSDPEKGKFLVDLEIQANQLVSANATVEPIVRVERYEKVTRYVPTIQFYGMIGVSPQLNTFKVSAGVDLKQKYLIGVSGLNLKDNYGYTIDFGVKF